MERNQNEERNPGKTANQSVNERNENTGRENELNNPASSSYGQAGAGQTPGADNRTANTGDSTGSGVTGAAYGQFGADSRGENKAGHPSADYSTSDIDKQRDDSSIHGTSREDQNDDLGQAGRTSGTINNSRGDDEEDELEDDQDLDADLDDDDDEEPAGTSGGL